MEKTYDFETLLKQVTEVLEFSQGYKINSSIIKNIMKKWEENKKYFIDKLDGELVWEFPEKVSLEIPEDTKKANYKNFVGWCELRSFNDNFMEFLDECDFTNLYQNKLSKEYRFENKSGEEVVIPAGIKFVKAFKYFFEDKDELHKYQDEASRFLQEEKIEGTLCFSVHPLDFLSVSENTYNWHSCHALDGEYRYGGLSYMQDADSFMVYIRGDKEEVLPDFPESVPWNSKKWRMMLYISNDKRVIMAGRPYPFKINQILDIIYDRFIIKKISSRFSIWQNDLIKEVRDNATGEIMHCTDVPYFYHHGSLFSLLDIVRDAEGSEHYNDLLRSSCYIPYYSIYAKTPYSINTLSPDDRFDIGAPAVCLNCGSGYVADESMFCSDCLDEEEQAYPCCMCHNYYSYDNLIIIADEGRLLCNECFSTHGFLCDECGLPYFIGERNMLEEDGQEKQLCVWCYRAEMERRARWEKEPAKVGYKANSIKLYDATTGEEIMFLDDNTTLSLTKE